MIRDGENPNKPPPRVKTDKTTFEVRGSAILEDDYLFGGDKPINKYFNMESLHHVLVFGSIVFGLKMIEMNWSVIKVFIDVNQSYIGLFLAVATVVYMNRSFYFSSKSDNENTAKWFRENF